MNNPQEELKTVIRSITEPKSSREILVNVSKYFTDDARIIHPMLNSPARAGKEGVLAAYKMLRVFTVNNKLTFHTVSFGEVQDVKGVEYLVGLIDLTERLQLRFLPLPTSYNPAIPLRLLVRIELRKIGDKWFIQKQEDNLPSDFGSTGLGLFGLGKVSDAIKWAFGVGTLTVGGTLAYFDIL